MPVLANVKSFGCAYHELRRVRFCVLVQNRHFRRSVAQFRQHPYPLDLRQLLKDGPVGSRLRWRWRRDGRQENQSILVSIRGPVSILRASLGGARQILLWNCLIASGITRRNLRHGSSSVSQSEQKP